MSVYPAVIADGTDAVVMFEFVDGECSHVKSGEDPPEISEQASMLQISATFIIYYS